MDTWFTYSGILETNKNQNNCYGHLTEELIDNTYDDNRRVNRSVRDPRQKLNIDLQLSLPIKMMDQVGVGCLFTSHLGNEKD